MLCAEEGGAGDQRKNDSCSPPMREKGYSDRCPEDEVEEGRADGERNVQRPMDGEELGERGNAEEEAVRPSQRDGGGTVAGTAVANFRPFRANADARGAIARGIGARRHIDGSTRYSMTRAVGREKAASDAGTRPGWGIYPGSSRSCEDSSNVVVIRDATEHFGVTMDTDVEACAKCLSSG